MLHFETVRYKNILSTGDVFTEIFLDRNPSTLIVGENGAGKSTILDAISFVLYGKAFRKITKPQLLNSINSRDLVVEIDFQTGGKNYQIRRGIKPNFFEIYEDGVMINQDSALRDYQKYLEENILKMNFKSFSQIVVLGSASFVPFMQLPAAARREVIEELLDINIFTTMNLLLKDKIRVNSDLALESKHNLKLLKTKLDSANEHNASLRKLKQDEISKIKSKISEQVAFVESEKGEMRDLQSRYDEIKDTIAHKGKIESEIKEHELSLQTLEIERKNTLKELKFFGKHSDECPSCKQGISDAHKVTVISDLQHILEVTIPAKSNTIATLLNEPRNEMMEIKKQESIIGNLGVSSANHSSNIHMAMNNLKSLQKDLTEASDTSISVDVTSINQSIRDESTNQETLLNEKEILSVSASMLKDGGIKTRIIKQYIPVMNTLINKYLASMDFFVDFQLDENFNETIKSRFRDVFSYASFSEGEKLRIDLALLFTWRSVAKLRNSVSTNLLIMDEIMDSSLDNNGTEEFLKILSELTADSNTMIISHKGDQLYDKFDNIISFEKHKSFSRIAA